MALKSVHSALAFGAAAFILTIAASGFSSARAATNTPSATPLSDSTSIVTATSSPIASTTATGTLRVTATDSVTATVSPTPTKTMTRTPSPTRTPTVTDTSTITPSHTPTNTLTFTPSNTPTATPTDTLTPTPTDTDTATITDTPTITPTNTDTATITNTPLPPRLDTIGVYRVGSFYLRLHNTAGYADYAITFYGGVKPYPIVGDWTGAGFDAIGTYDQKRAFFTLCMTSNAGCASNGSRLTFGLGAPGDIPLSGRWSSAATHDGVGLFRPSNGTAYLRNDLSSGPVDYTMVVGLPGDRGVAGDWTGKDFDSPGVYRPDTGMFYLSNKVANGTLQPDISFSYGLGTDLPIVGDWLAQGHDGIGLMHVISGSTSLKNDLTSGDPDNTFVFKTLGDIPIAGHWQKDYPGSTAVPLSVTAPTATPTGS